VTEKTVNYETGEVLPAATDPKAQAALFAKLAKVMGKLKKLPKTGYNTHFKYKFVTDGDVSDAVRAALASEGVAFFASLQLVSSEDGGKTKRGDVITKTLAEFIFTFADGETGATWSCNWTGEAIDTQDKGIAKAATSALKYFLLKTFVLSAGDPTDDSDNAPSSSGQPATKGEVGDDDQDPETTNGNGLTAEQIIAKNKAKYIARINELNKQLTTPNDIDQTWLSEMTKDELVGYGQMLSRSVSAEADTVPDDLQGVE